MCVPDAISIIQEKRPNTSPNLQSTVMKANVQNIGNKVCPDNLHLCPITAECCQTMDGKGDCCRKTSFPIILGECCHQFVYKWICCNDMAPKCHYWGCHWS
ncbi:hypothetical protein HNY73_004787 [Argiope bruennichi]|uniref:Granulins domain-containing protein n=1 Tax=Argiope bruennichi TaxID=94029 RepID=A0A8T0FQA6_ARGBR|nr:hypothetical protein HNY73_004787 [Argiope bruennichi]